MSHRLLLSSAVLFGLASCISFPRAEQEARLQAERGGEKANKPFFYNPLSNTRSEKKSGGSDGGGLFAGQGADESPARKNFRDPYFRGARSTSPKDDIIPQKPGEAAAAAPQAEPAPAAPEARSNFRDRYFRQDQTGN